LDKGDDGIFMYKQIEENRFVQLFANKKFKSLVGCKSDEQAIATSLIDKPLLQHQSDDNTSFVSLEHIM
jgi:hypothetical protein